MSDIVSLHKRLIEKRTQLCVVGLGYVGLPVAAAFSKKINVIGFDINSDKILKYSKGIFESDFCIKNGTFGDSIVFTTDEKRLKYASVFIIAVPTPTNEKNEPDLNYVLEACEVVARNMPQGSCIVFESTVYPGTTDEICIPLLEKVSKMKCGIDFKVGYSPERINPGDVEHQFNNTAKVVSGCDKETLDFIVNLYKMVVSAEVYPADSIKVAEASKILENVQRDVNIALVNEVAQIFKKMNIDMSSVVAAASTKWNFQKFYPGLVGGHCIGIDSYYLLHKSKQYNCLSQVIEASRMVNESVSRHCADVLIEKLLSQHEDLSKLKVAFLGVAFKENCGDIRNTKVIDIVAYVEARGIKTVLCDEHVDPTAFEKKYNKKLTSFAHIHAVDAVVVAVGHDEYKDIAIDQLKALYNCTPYIILDLKGIYSKELLEKSNFWYWKL